MEFDLGMEGMKTSNLWQHGWNCRVEMPLLNKLGIQTNTTWSNPQHKIFDSTEVKSRMVVTRPGESIRLEEKELPWNHHKTAGQGYQEVSNMAFQNWQHHIYKINHCLTFSEVRRHKIWLLYCWWFLYHWSSHRHWNEQFRYESYRYVLNRTWDSSSCAQIHTPDCFCGYSVFLRKFCIS